MWGDVEYDGDLSSLVSVSAGDTHGVVLDSEGKVWAWGNNEYGQLGNGQTAVIAPCVSVPVTVPIQPTGLDGKAFTQVAAGYCHSIALESTGNVWIWGAAIPTCPPLPGTIPVPMLFQKEDGSAFDGVTAVALGGDSVWAVNNDGILYRLNMSGIEPVKGPDGTGELGEIIAVAAWGHYTLALSRDGSVYEWVEWGNYTYYDELEGRYKPVSRPFPTRVKVEGGSPLTNIVAIAAGRELRHRPGQGRPCLVLGAQRRRATGAGPRKFQPALV